MNKINKMRAILHGIGVVVSALSAGLTAMFAGGDPATATFLGATVGTTAAVLGEVSANVM